MPISEDERQVLLDSLMQWLENERLETLARFQKEGTPLTRKLRRVFAERQFDLRKEADEKKGTWSFVKTGEDEVDVSRFRLPHKALPMRWKGSTRSPIAPSPPKPETEIKCAGKVIGSESDDWFAESMLARYFSALPNIAESNTALASQIVTEHLDYLFGDSVGVAEECLCGGIVPHGEAVTIPGHGVELRRLNNEELGAIFEKSFLRGIGDNEDFNLDFAENCLQNLTMLPPELMIGSTLAVRYQTSKEDAADGPLRSARLVLAIQLLGFTVCGRGVVRKWVERGPNRNNMPETILLPKLPEFEERLISTDDLIRACELSRRIPDGVSDPHGREEVALNQFAIGASQESDAEAVIAFMISLEALFVPGLQGESSYRFRLNGARFLGADLAERRAIYEDLKKLYQVRSRLVHGAPPDKDEIKSAKKNARTLAARALVKALTEGWPKGADFEDAALQ